MLINMVYTLLPNALVLRNTAINCKKIIYWKRPNNSRNFEWYLT